MVALLGWAGRQATKRRRTSIRGGEASSGAGAAAQGLGHAQVAQAGAQLRAEQHIAAGRWGRAEGGREQRPGLLCKRGGWEGEGSRLRCTGMPGLMPARQRPGGPAFCQLEINTKAPCLVN